MHDHDIITIARRIESKVDQMLREAEIIARLVAIERRLGEFPRLRALEEKVGTLRDPTEQLAEAVAENQPPP